MDRSSVGSHAYQNTFDTSIELLPNPDFVFPMAAPDSTSSLSVDAAHSNRLRPLQTMNAARRNPAHALRKSVNALPEFSFNPSGNASALNPTTPPLSPLPTSPTTPRNAGHRRGGSEFIGGDSRGVNVLSTSPTKTDSMLPPPPSTLQPGPPPGRRGHAHRRSAAISCHDLSSILQPTDANANGRGGGSAPATPRESEMNNWPRHIAHKSLSQPSLHTSSEENQAPNHDGDHSPRRPPSRARVGFSDRVEYIRPLSTISSETESSMSTIRGHSVSNSLSSVISASAPSPPSSRMTRPFPNTTLENEARMVRPKTAGAVLDKATKAKDAFNLDLFGRQRPTNSFNLPSPGSPSPLPSPVIRSSKKSFFKLNHKRAQPSIDLLTSNSEPSLISSSLDSPPDSPIRDSTQETTADASTKDKSKRARKVKSWTKPFGSKKPKSPLARPVDLTPQIPTPPLSSLPLDTPLQLDDLSLDDLSANFDVDNTVTIVTPTTEVVPQRPQLQTDIASWQPKHLASPDSDSRSPVIDLDLALGPFEAGKRGRGGGRNFASARRTMHSSGFASGLFPGNMNHRRTESAPALVPFELRKAASTGAMADVFEEDEEEVTEETTAVKPVSETPVKEDAKSSDVPKSKADEPCDDFGEPGDEDESSVGIQVVESDLSEESPMTWDFEDSGLGIHRANKPKPLSFETDPLSPIARTMDCAEGPDPIEVVEDYEEPRTSSLTRSSDSTVTPTFEDGPKELQQPISLAVPLPKQTVTTPDTIHSSSSFSPDFRYRQNSFDGPRLGTAGSSATDNRTINSFAFGEPGPEVRISTDDVPSLTSSRSTMTGGFQYGGFPMLSPRNPGDRTSSISSSASAMSDRRRKRSSIASLSRLMTGSFGGERSKLHIEQRPQSEHMDLSVMKRPKDKKTKRLSKLMQFWRSSSYSK